MLPHILLVGEQPCPVVNFLDFGPKLAMDAELPSKKTLRTLALVLNRLPLTEDCRRLILGQARHNWVQRHLRNFQWWRSHHIAIALWTHAHECTGKHASWANNFQNYIRSEVYLEQLLK